jgi:hypothetical protein
MLMAFSKVQRTVTYLFQDFNRPLIFNMIVFQNNNLKGREIKNSNTGFRRPYSLFPARPCPTLSFRRAVRRAYFDFLPFNIQTTPSLS